MAHKKGFYEKYIKRPQDMLCAGAAILVLSPVMAVTAVLVRVKLGSPVLFRQVRPGRDGKPFTMYKFRSMTDARDENGEFLPDEERLPPFGQKLRSTSLDELPELFNILKGDMSFVGPRPELLLYTKQYTEEQQCIMWVRPGVTDRSSIVYIAQDEIVGEEDPVENFERLILPEKNRLRVEYAKSQSFPLDCQLIFETIKGVFGKAEDMAREKRTGE